MRAFSRNLFLVAEGLGGNLFVVGFDIRSCNIEAPLIPLAGGLGLAWVEFAWAFAWRATPLNAPSSVAEFQSAVA